MKTDEEIYANVKKLYGGTCDITKIKGSKVDLTKLFDNQKVCAGGKGYYFLLTEKSK